MRGVHRAAENSRAGLVESVHGISLSQVDPHFESVGVGASRQCCAATVLDPYLDSCQSEVTVRSNELSKFYADAERPMWR